jgi:glycosyltransferase involved in cell wall biosynthesis
MRVAYFTHYAHLLGANRALLELMIGLRERHGVSPHVLLPAEGPFMEVLEAHHVPCSVVPFGMWMQKRRYMGGIHHRLRQVFREERAARARLKELEEGVPALAAICRELRIDLVHSNSIIMLSGLLVAQQIKLPHVWHVRELFREHYGLTPDGGERRFRRAIRSSDAVIAISDAVATSLRTAMGSDAFKLHRIHDAPFRAQELVSWRDRAGRHQRRDGTFRFIQVGLFHPSKGQLLSLEAFAEVHRQFPDTRLVFVGDGQMDAVKDRIRELGLQDVVELKGFVPDAMPLFLDADCVLNPSRFEAFGRTTVEAMAVGVPVIGHASGATPELIAPGIGGQVFSGGHHELAACMRHYLEHPDVVRDAGRRGMQRVAELFTMEPMLDKVMGVYRSLHGQVCKDGEVA